jgi:hypothetical protein
MEPSLHLKQKISEASKGSTLRPLQKCMTYLGAKIIDTPGRFGVVDMEPAIFLNFKLKEQ